MKAEEIEALAALEAAATKAPWRAESGYRSNMNTYIRGTEIGPVVATTRYRLGGKRDEDTALIVALRNHATALLAAARENEVLREAMKSVESEALGKAAAICIQRATEAEASDLFASDIRALEARRCASEIFKARAALAPKETGRG